MHFNYIWNPKITWPAPKLILVIFLYSAHLTFFLALAGSSETVVKPLEETEGILVFIKFPKTLKPWVQTAGVCGFGPLLITFHLHKVVFKSR